MYTWWGKGLWCQASYPGSSVGTNSLPTSRPTPNRPILLSLVDAPQSPSEEHSAVPSPPSTFPPLNDNYNRGGGGNS